MKYIKKSSFLISVVIMLSLTVIIYGFSGGITGKTKKNGNGCTCHGNFSQNVNVSIEGPEVMNIGTTENYSVTISGGPLVAAGTNISASAGNLTAGEGLQLLSGELTHQQPKLPSNNKVTFTFSLTAPLTEGEVTLFANGNSVNLDGSNSGDQWNFAPEKVIKVQNPTNIDFENIPQTLTLNQNYPNPFNPSTTIQYSLPKPEFATIKVFDVMGKEVAELVSEYQSAGMHKINFDASRLSSGIYFYKLLVGSQSQTKKFILIK